MNQAVSFGLLLGGGVLLVSVFSGKSLADVVSGKGPFTVSTAGANLLTGGVSGVGSTIAGSSTATTGSPSAQKMLAAAQQAASSNIAYSKQVQSSGLLAGFRADCSGFVSWVLDQGGLTQFASDPTTQGIPDLAGVESGPGSQVTIWDREDGSQAHVIIDILGNWFESGGNSTYNPSGGISELTPAEAQGELSAGGFTSLHPSGL